MGNNLPRTIQLQLCYDTNLIPTFPFDKHAILYFLKVHTAEVGELSFSLAVIFSKFLFSLLENKIVWGKVREEIKLCIQKILQLNLINLNYSKKLTTTEKVTQVLSHSRHRTFRRGTVYFSSQTLKDSSRVFQIQRN